MNNPLEDIANYLKDQNYQNVFVDGFVVFPVDSDPKNHEQINVQGEPSTTKVGITTLRFGIYLKAKSRKDGYDRSKAIRNLLGNLGGKLVVNANAVSFKKFFVVTEPYFWGVSQANENIYLTRYKAILSDRDVRII